MVEVLVILKATMQAAEEIKVEQQGPLSIVEAIEGDVPQIIPQQNLPSASS